jgi:hypothetical protein
MVRVNFFIVWLLCIVPATVFADFRLSDYQKTMDSPTAKLYVMGTVEGIIVANNALSINGRDKLFCMPSTEQFIGEVIFAFLDLQIGLLSRKEKESNPSIAAIMMRGLQYAFPCEQTSAK